MKHFIYTYRETKKGDSLYKTVRVYQVHRNIPKLICERSDTFVSETQLVLEALEDQQALSPAAFVKNDSGSMVHGNFWSMQNERFAVITRIN